MKSNISDLMDRWPGPVPPLEDQPVADLDALRARTLEKVRAQGKRTKGRRVPRAVVLAAVLAACVVLAGAATGQLQAVLTRDWRHDTLVSSPEEAAADAARRAEETGENVAYGWINPNGDPPVPLEEMVEKARAKSASWDTGDCIGGTFGPLINQWTGPEVTDQTGAVWSRTIHGVEQGHSPLSALFPRTYTKYEYTARTPADLDTVLSGLVTPDTDWLTETFTAPDWANFYYRIYDSRQVLRGEVCHLLYTLPEGIVLVDGEPLRPGGDLHLRHRAGGGDPHEKRHPLGRHGHAGVSPLPLRRVSYRGGGGGHPGPYLRGAGPRRLTAITKPRP